MALQDDINNFGSTGTAIDLVILAAQVANTTTNRVVTVASVDDLPDLTVNNTVGESILFVESINTPVVAHLGSWRGLDGRELRADCQASVIRSWGCNNCGQLGTGNLLANATPGPILGGFTDWCQVAAGDFHSLAVRTNGTLWAWGRNSLGHLGDGTTVAKSSPVSVVGGFTDWCQVSAGYSHSLAVRANGTLWAWGYGNTGALGSGSLSSQASPVSVVGGFTDWCWVGAGIQHSMGLRTNGSLWTWGCNSKGELGANLSTAVRVSSPVSVAGGFTDWCQAAVGRQHNLAIRTNGTLWSWGYNNSGRLGDGTVTNRSSPVSVVGGFTDWCRVSANCQHSIGLRTNGTLWAWGDNGSGALGDGTGTSRLSPVSVLGGFTDWCYISAGYGFNLAIRTNGTLWGWGRDACYQLGDFSSINKTSPVQVCCGFTDWCQVSGGGRHSLGIRSS